MLYALSFLLLFTIGGLTGLFLGILSVDVHLHDTYFVVAHFHYVMMGSTLVAFLGALHYWWPKFTGQHVQRVARPDVRDRRVLRLQPDVLAAVRDGRARHAAPLLGLRSAVPDLPPALDDRRVHPRHLDVHHGRLPVLRRFKNGKKAPRNPWGGSTLEWQAPTPPTLYNFEKPPVLHELYNYDDLVEVEPDVWERRALEESREPTLVGEAGAVHAAPARRSPETAAPTDSRARPSRCR